MEQIKELNTFTKVTLGLGILFLIYGFLSRLIPINFLWESKSIGWGLTLVGLIGLLVNGIDKRQKANKKTIWNKIGIGIISFILLIQLILIAIIPNTDAYKDAKEFIINDEEIKSELGEIKGFGLIPTGGISIQSDSKGETGNADINLIIKGNKSFKSVKVFVFTDYGKDWQIVGME